MRVSYKYFVTCVYKFIFLPQFTNKTIVRFVTVLVNFLCVSKNCQIFPLATVDHFS